jgi:DNA-binding transcriptional ArsR family regulator
MSSKTSPEKNGPAMARVAAIMQALAHPIRVAALLALAERELSPVELTRRFDDREWSLGVIAYHTRTLAKAGLIELSDTIQRRGAIEHRYSVTPVGSALAQAIRRLQSGTAPPRR